MIVGRTFKIELSEKPQYILPHGMGINKPRLSGVN